MLCPFCKEEINEGAVKCRFCWEFLTTQKEKKKNKIWCLWMCLIIFFWSAILAWIFWINNNSNTSSTTSTPKIETPIVNEGLSLTDSYNKHKNFIWQVCQEWLKLISTNQEHEFEGPTYAWEYLWKFVVKWTDHWILFRCDFIPYNNEWWMNLENVEWEY